MLDSKANNSLWADSKERFKGKSLDSNLDFDVAIIGGGFSGLWTAFHLNQIDRTLRIAIFEAREIGFRWKESWPFRFIFFTLAGSSCCLHCF